MIPGRLGYYLRKNRRLFFASILAAMAGLAVILFLLIKAIKAESLPDDTRVYENDLLTYYITVNGDGIDYEGAISADDAMSKEYSGTTSVTDTLPEGLTFEGFVTTDDGTFGAVSREDETIQCSGHVIDDTNEESVADGAWNADETEYTYHGLHYNASTRTVSFRTKAITGGCKLTIGVKTRVPYLRKNEYRRDFYDTAYFVDETIIDSSNTVHAYIQRNRPVAPKSEETEKPNNWSYYISYEYRGDIPEDAPDLPAQAWYESYTQVSFLDAPEIECYSFDGWNYDRSGTKTSVSALNGRMPSQNLDVYGIFTYTCGNDDPGPGIDYTKYNVTYEIDGEKPDSFIIPRQRSYMAGASVDIDPTAEDENIDGYSFSGWDSSDIDIDEVQAFTMPAQNVTLRGNFEREKYTVSYVYDGEVIPDGANDLLPQTQSYYAGDEVATATDVSADGYTFSGWLADDTFEMPANNVVIHGEWTKIYGELRPEITIVITNPQDLYHKGDRVKFETTIKNTQNVNIQDLYIEELLDGAVFISGDGYSIQEDKSFAKIDNLPANASIKLYSEIKLPLNISKVWTNIVELIAFETADDSYRLAEDFDGKASVDFESEYIEGLPEDYDPERVDPEPDSEDKSNPRTFDGSSKYIVSCIIISISIVTIVVIIKRNRRGYGKYAKVAGIAVASLAIITVYNGGFSFADTLEERTYISFSSVNADYREREAGSWHTSAKAEWVDVATAQITYNIESVASPDFHEKDVVLVMDNSDWTGHAIDGTPVDRPDDPTALDEMKREAKEYVGQLLADGDSTITVLSVWDNMAPVKTSDPEEAKTIIDSIQTTRNSNFNSYSVALYRVDHALDAIERTDNYGLRIMLVTDDHNAHPVDIYSYRALKKKYEDSVIIGIGFGDKEISNERFSSWEAAEAYGVARLWHGDDGDVRSIGRYYGSETGNKLISDYHVEPYAFQLDSTLLSLSGPRIAYEEFGLTADINTDEFDIDSFGMTLGSARVEAGKIIWNPGEELITGTDGNKLVINLVAKDTAIAKHKLYQLIDGTHVQSDTKNTPADDITDTSKLVLMNGYELSFDANNPGRCTLGENDTVLVWAAQIIHPDEDGVSCDGWNFDSFKSDEGIRYMQDKPNRMPSSDLELKATWRKTNVEVHMDGTVYVIAPAVLAKGSTVSANLVRAVTGKPDGYATLEMFLKADTCPEYAIQESNRISDDDSPTPIYAYAGAGRVGPNPDSDEFDEMYPNGYSYYGAEYYCTEADQIVLNEDSSYLFGGYTNFRYFDPDIANWDASNVKNLSYLFGRDSSVNNVRHYSPFRRISEWDVSNVEDMSGIFANTTLTDGYDSEHLLEDWDTSKVTNLSSAFSDSWGTLDNLPGVSHWNTSNVTDMSNIFYMTGKWNGSSYTPGTVSLNNVSSWNTSNVENLSGAFAWIQTNDLTPISGWDVRKVKNMSEMLYNYGQKYKNGSWKIHSADAPASLAGLESWHTDSLEDLGGFLSYAAVDDLTPISGWNVTKVKSVSALFSNTDFLTNIDPIGGWQTNSLENMGAMFYSQQGITSLDALAGWNTQNVKNMGSLIYSSNITDISAMSSWSDASLESLSNTFAYTKITDVNDLSGWTTPNLKDLAGIFRDTPNLTDISGVSGWNVEGVESMSEMLRNTAVSSLQPLSNWTTTSLKYMDNFLYGHKNITSLAGLGGWNTSNVTQMDSAFRGYSSSTSYQYTDWSLRCNTSLTDISALQNWNVSNAMFFTYEFACNDKITSVEALSNWVPNAANSYYGIFAGDKSLTSLDGLEKWGDLDYRDSKEISMGAMFINNTALVDISALENWDMPVSSVSDMFRNDRNINNLTYLNNLGVTRYTSRQNTFDNIPSTVTRPDWF